MIKNFFITGLSQETLKEKIELSINEQVQLNPEVLYSLYQEESGVIPFLKFVFPKKISIEQSDSDVIPKYFTFMSTEGDGSVSYFHSLIFYEQITNHDIKEDFDHHAARMKNKMRQKSSSLFKR